MGAVYKAHHLFLDKEVALKTFRTPNLTDDSWKRFQREAQTLARLEHNNIVQIFDFGLTEDNLPYYTMECLPGETLQERINNRGSLSLSEAIPVFLQVAQALSVAHKKGIIHRDIKPANIFLAINSQGYDKSECVKVVDFGAAGLANQSMDGQKLTSTGTIFGSPLYMSPEQAAGQPVGPASDIYSTGCALFHAITGQPPYRGENVFATMLMHQNSQVPNPNKQGEGFPQRMEALISKMLAKEAAERIQTFDQVEKDLSQILEDHRRAMYRDGGRGYSGTRKQDREEEADPGGTVRGINVPLLVAGMVLCLSVSMVCIWWLNSDLPPWRKPHSAGTEAQRHAGSPVPAVPKTSAVISPQGVTKYLQIANRAGYKLFKFPPDYSLGDLEWKVFPPAGPEQMSPLHTQAQGIIEMPVQAMVTLVGNETLASHPELLNGFGPNDLDTLTFPNDYQFGDKQLAYVGSLKGLRNLFIVGGAATDKSINVLKSLNNLVTLSVKGASLSGAHMSTLSRLPELHIFKASGMSDISKVLKRLQHSNHMAMLFMEHCQLTDRDMEICGTMPNLQNLDIPDNPLVDDAGLKFLVDLHYLKELNIGDTKVTPASIETLKKLPALESLTVDWTGEQLKRLRKALPPTCKIKPYTALLVPSEFRITDETGFIPEPTTAVPSPSKASPK